MRLILASGSERRRELLSWLDLKFEVIVSGFDESSVKQKNPSQLVKKLALSKALLVIKNKLTSKFQLQDSILVIGADTVVAIGSQIIGKPKDKKDAVRILKELSGKTHSVFTGVAVIFSRPGLGKKKTGSLVEAEETRVTFRKLKDYEIRDYAASGEPLDKGGAYAIQMGAKDFVEKIEGSYTNVVGLPLLLLQKLLKKQGYKIEKDTEEIICQKTGYCS